MSKSELPFGYFLGVDIRGVKDGLCDDMEFTYRLLEKLVDVLGMTPMAPPVVIHAPTKKGVELYPDKAGISAWQPLIESGIQIHAIEPTHEVYIDIFSCAFFYISDVMNFLQAEYGGEMKIHFITRG